MHLVEDNKCEYKSVYYISSYRMVACAMTLSRSVSLISLNSENALRLLGNRQFIIMYVVVVVVDYVPEADLSIFIQ